MGNLPLHPLIVHLPLVLAVLLPPLIAVILWREWRRGATTHLWQLATLAAVLLTIGAFVSVRTGEVEKERVETVVPESAVHDHEERAELFQWVTLAPLALLVGTVLTKRQRLRRYAANGALVASLVVAGLAIAVGESGGSLVYEHNAGAAYATTGPSDRPAESDEHDHH